MTYAPEHLAAVFGPETQGATPEERARTSSRVWVRSLDGIAEDSPPARGRRLTASEVLGAYGWDVLREVAAEGSTLLCADRDAAARAIRVRREHLGLTERQVAARAGLTEDDVVRSERGGRWPIRTYERIARVLGLDERYISVRADPVGNEKLTVRLRTMGDTSPRMSPTVVSAIAEAAWVALVQVRLCRDLGLGRVVHGLKASSNYGGPGYPPYRHGYFLASQAREGLGLGLEAPIQSMRNLCEEVLGIPVVQTELGQWVAGVTVEIADEETPVRAIVCNLSGRNRNVLVRRMTLAHELGHLLFDPSQRLDTLRVDEYDDFERPPEQIYDPVEQRANAFAVQFLVPTGAVLKVFESKGQDHAAALEHVVDAWGVSLTAARYQLWNGLDRSFSLGEISTRARPPAPDWAAQESYTTDWHPLQQLQFAPARAGKFSAVVGRAAEERLISWDTAAEYLLSKPDDIKAALGALRDLYPSVWQGERPPAV